MTEPILDPNYWRERLIKAERDHQAIYLCSAADWEAIADRHRAILKENIKPNDSILDAGCGWGRLLTLLPADWIGNYFGVDLSPDFIRLAKQQYPKHAFTLANILDLPTFALKFDWAVLISIRPMIVRNCGAEYWSRVEAKLRANASKLLFLEYDPDDPGSVE